MSTGVGRRGPLPGGGPVRRDPNRRLLQWRGGLALMLAGIAVLLRLISPEQVALPGVVGSLGLMATTLAVAWAVSQAGVPTRILLAGQLAADTVCLGLLVNFTGGPYSAFPLVFVVPIMLGAYFLGSRAAMAIAGCAAIFTGGGHFGLALGWLLTGTGTELDYLHGWPVLVTALHMSLFIFTGMLSGALSRRLAVRRMQQVRNDLIIEKTRCEVRNILDNIRSGLITVDPGGCITRANPAACTILRCTEEELLGKPLKLVMSGGMEELAAIIQPVALGSPSVHRGEVQVTSRGRTMPLGLNVNPVTTTDGAVIGAIAIFTDLTREKEMTARMREADRLAAVGELAASIAHEIRNPLASIRGSIEIMAGELDLDGHLDQLMSLILKESGRVNTIINDFLAYSRMRPVSLRRFRGAEFLEEISLQIGQHVAAHGGKVELRSQCEPGHLQLTADPGQLTQLTLNLVINACEAMGYQGRITLLLRRCDDGESCELEVTDNGPGIEEDIREQLFAPFKTTKEKGTGLGLAMVARIAASHGGRVVAGDAPGGGARFTVLWPLEPPRRDLDLSGDDPGSDLPVPADPGAILVS
ncbi:PAS domain S-box protein [bacterium]|nr:PAS domain S-box protein [bacterium]